MRRRSQEALTSRLLLAGYQPRARRSGAGRTASGAFRGPKPKAERKRKPVPFATNPAVEASYSRREPGGIVLVLPLLHPSLNEWARHDTPWAQRERKEKTRAAVHAFLVSLGLFGRGGLVVPGRVIVTSLSLFGDRRRRDFDNFVPKFFLDALRGIVFEDDATNCVVELRLRHGYAGKAWRTEITIEPAP